MVGEQKNGENMKTKLSNEAAVRELHVKYAAGLTDEELKEWWLCIQSSNFKQENPQLPEDIGITRLREDLDRAVKFQSVTNAEKIQQWFKSQPFLPQPSLGIIHKFLWASKEDPDQCKKKLMRFYSLRGTDDDLFSNRDPSSPAARQVYESSYFACLPGHTPELFRVTISALKDLNPDAFVPKEWLKRVFNMADIRVRDDFCLGDILIFDLKGFSMQHLLKFQIILAKKMVVASEGALPIRIKQIHMINCPAYIDKILALFKPFLKEKMVRRIIVHTNTLDELYKFVPRELLPNEYGGKAGPFHTLSSKWVKEFEDNQEWFIKEERNMKRMYNEAKKEGKIYLDVGELFGVEGSFKQLSID